jgi:hypothetical protein
MLEEIELERVAPVVWGTVNHVERVYSLPRFTIYKRINDGTFESRVVGQTKKDRGRRLILIASVEKFIASSPRESRAMKRAMSKLGLAAGISKRAAKLRRGKRKGGGK